MSVNLVPALLYHFIYHQILVIYCLLMFELFHMISLTSLFHEYICVVFSRILFVYMKLACICSDLKLYFSKLKV